MIHDWPRFWADPDAQVYLADDGFLTDPTAAGLRDLQSVLNVRQLDEIADRRCLILLGEPGLGKTQAINAEAARVATECEGSEHCVLHVDLGSTRTESVLYDEIFGSTEFLGWRNSSSELHLFLDALDEAVLRIGVVGDLILRGLSSVDKSRLRLRLTCRTADRIRSFEEALLSQFKSDETGVFELQPLRKVDVRRAAEDWNQDPDEFIKQLLVRDIVPLAIKPVTLAMLLGLAAEAGGLPTSQLDLYRRGLIRLVADRSERRTRDPQTRGTLSASQRLSLAGRIAAATYLTGRTRISTGDSSEPSGDVVTLPQLSGGYELDRGVAVSTAFPVSESDVRQVLNTGLFSARGEDLGWAHQTYAEYLAATYITTSSMSRQQRFSLLASPAVRGTRVVPQLRDLAGWASAMDANLMEDLIHSDPLVLLRGEVALASESRKRRIVEAIFDPDVAIELDRNRYDPRVRRNLAGLDHDGLAATVEGVLNDQSRPAVVRRVACDVIRACTLAALVDDLAGIALRDSEPIDLRVEAVRSLSGLAAAENLQRLTPMLRLELVDDNDDELRGSVLHATCPAVLSAADALELLTRPKTPHFFGAYERFISRDLPAALTADELPQALRWLRQHADPDPLSNFSTLGNQILALGIRHIRAQNVREELAETITHFVTHHIDLGSRRIDEGPAELSDIGVRREIVESLIPAIREERLDPVTLVMSNPRLISADDLGWTIEGLEDAIGTEDEFAWANLVFWAGRFQGVDHEMIMAAREASARLFDLTRRQFGPIDLSSELASEMRRHHAQEQAWERERQEHEAGAPDFDANIDFYLDRFDSGDLDAFWQLNIDLWGNPGDRFVSFGEADLTQSPGWLRAPDSRRARIAEAAATFVREYPPREYWIDPTQGFQDAAAGYRAVRYLAEHDTNKFVELTSLDRWAMPMLTFHHGGAGGGVIDAWILQQTADRCPEAVAEAASARILAEANRDDGYLFVLRRLEPLLAGGIGESLLQLWRNTPLPPRPRGQLLSALITHGPDDAAEVGRAALTREAEGELNESARAVAVALLATDLRAWSVVEPLVVEHPDWGGTVFEQLAHDDGRSLDFRAQMPDSALADLFVWLIARFPPEADPSRTEARMVGPRDQVADYRDQIIRILIGRGTPESAQAIRDIERRIDRDLTWARLQVDENVLRGEWAPLRPEDVVRVANESQRRFVLSAGDLQRVVLEALSEIQDSLDAQAHQLWDTTAGRPKNEVEVTAWVASRLNEILRGRGIIINREVEIRVSPTGGLGERTDIHVDAIAGAMVEGAPLVTVVIEVKCCWNAELRQALRSQLAERYLGPSRPYGIYLVAMFGANHWTDATDRRRARCAQVQADELVVELRRQADELRSEDIAIEPFVLNGTLS